MRRDLDKWLETKIEFQSTHPVRGATQDGTATAYAMTISIHAPREGCDSPLRAAELIAQISIHAPREGCDLFDAIDENGEIGFQSTHPVRGATRLFAILRLRRGISIHAPREGCDPPAHRWN